MLRKHRSRNVPPANRRTIRCLRLEDLESRQLLSASGFQTDYLNIAAASSAIRGYTPAQIRAAYGFNSVSFGSTAADGHGQTIAIIDAYNDPNIASDLATFDQAMGIGAPPSLTVVNQNGGANLPGTDPSQGWEGETALDVEWAHAVAPGANILLVEASSASDVNLFAAVNYARQQAGVSVISMSWGSNDSLANQQNDQSLSAQYLVTPTWHQGITFVASSGDSGLPSFPAESPNVLAVGGSDLYLTSSGAISSETAWTPTQSGGQIWSGGGGVSQEFPGRKVPDVAYNAGVGMAVYDTFGPDHGWVAFGGTSAGAPQWAALVAIANQGRALAGQATLNGATQTLAAIYAAPSADFHDITTGSTQYQSAGVGYDLATGRGSPVANQLIPFLASYGSSGGTGGTTTAPLAPANFTANALSATQVSLGWSASAGATGYNVYELENSQAVLIGTYASGTTSATVSNLSAGTTYSFEVAAYNAVGSSASGWLHVTTSTANVVVTAPQNLQVVATSSTTVQASWSASPGATGYLVYEWSGYQVVQVASLGTGTTSATIGSLTPGTTAHFYVTAYNSTSSASTSWVSVAIPSAVTLTAPQNLQVVATSSTTAQLSWNGSPGATGYRVYEWNGYQAVQVASLGAGTTSTSIGSLTPGTTAYFYVTAFNSTSSASTSWTSVVMPSAAALSAPQNLVASATSATTGSLSWSPSAGATGYQIYYWNGFRAVVIGNVGATTTSVTIQGLTAGSTTYFAVVAYNSTSAAASNWVALTTPVSSAVVAADVAFSQSVSQRHYWNWLS